MGLQAKQSGVDESVRHALTRRRLLKLGVGLGGAALLAGSGAAYVLWPRAPGEGRRVLSDAEARFVDAVADAYLPPGNPFGVAATEVDIVSGVEDYIDALPEPQGRQLRALFVAVDQWPRVSLQSPRAFAEMSRDGRVAVLRAFETSSIRERQQLVTLLRLLVGIPYFENERVIAAAGIAWGCPVIP